MEIKMINCGLLGTNCYILTEGTDAVVFDPDGEKDKIYSPAIVCSRDNKL